MKNIYEKQIYLKFNEDKEWHLAKVEYSYCEEEENENGIILEFDNACEFISENKLTNYIVNKNILKRKPIIRNVLTDEHYSYITFISMEYKVEYVISRNSFQKIADELSVDEYLEYMNDHK